MAILLALLSALSYGTSDFSSGLASRRWAPEAVSGATVATEVAFAVVGTILYGGHGPTVHALAWGAVSGVGGGTGTIALYRGFTTGAMTVVGTLSGVVAAVLPVIVGLALGDHLGPGAAIGIVIAIPAIGLVSWQSGGGADDGSPRLAALFGLLAGLGFALLFVGLQRAGTRAGAWPILPGQLTGLCVVSPFAVRAIRRAGRPSAGDVSLALLGGVLGGAAALLFLVSTGKGELSIVAVFASMYPAFTVLLARGFLGERWSRLQATGLLIAAASVILVSVS
jgi:drug/metabolite transporter (DMT)-like permease